MVQATKEQIIANRTFATERYILSTMPVLYLPLWKTDSGESGDSFISSDGHGHLCTVTGALWTPNGRVFDGADDVVDCGALSSPTDAVTCECWFKQATDGVGFETLFGWSDGDGRDPIWLMVFADGTDLFWYLDGVRDWQATGVAVDLRGQWVHYVATYDKDAGANNQIFYRNAVAEYSVTSTGAINASTGNLQIGANRTIEDEAKGKIGEARLYNRALTSLEVQNNYIATKWRYQ